MIDIMLNNLLSPVVLFFVLGLLAALVKSDLKFPSALSESLSIYLLIAIGLKGGIELSHYTLQEVYRPILGTLFLGVAIPIVILNVLRGLKMDMSNAVGLAATYGSVSIVTYGAAISFLELYNVSYEGYMNAMVVLLESPAILVSLLLLSLYHKQQKAAPIHNQSFGITAGSVAWAGGWLDKEVLKESLFGKSVLLLMGSLVVGWFVGEGALTTVKPLFIDLYPSVLMLFLLNMGLIAGQRLPEVTKHGVKLLLFGIVTPIVCGGLGVLVGSMVGLSLGGTMLMGVLAGSASYIAAPAALRTSVPDANPSVYLGLSLGITFPFNLTLGIPLYYFLAQLAG